MKHYSLARLGIILAVALIGAMSLVVSARSTPPVGEPDDATVRVRLEVDRTVLPAEVTEQAVVKIALDGVRLPSRGHRPPVNLAIVIDRSGSMAGDKIAKARDAALEAVRRLAPDDLVSLIVYDTNVQTLVPAQRVANGRRLEQAIRGIEVGGNTALYGGVTRGADEVRKNLEDRRFVNRVILLSDGLANVGPSSPEELGRLGASLMKEGISVTTIGLGLGFNEDLMTRLAQRSDGNTYFVEHSGDLPQIFAAELGEVLSVVARRVVIEIEFPAGVRPLCFVGRDGRIHGQKAELTLNQIYAGQEKFALIEVEVSPESAGAEREIARAKVTYENAFNQRALTATAQRTVRFSESRSAVVRSADHTVQTDYARNVLAVAKDEAVTLVDSDRRQEAATRLREKSEVLKKIGEAYGNSSVKQLAAAVPPEAKRLEKEGLSNTERKLYRADNAQVRGQQSSATSASRP